GDDEQVDGVVGDVLADADVTLDDDAGTRRGDDGARPQPLLVQVALAVAADDVVGLPGRLGDLVVGDAPGAQGALGPLAGVAPGDDVAARLVEGVAWQVALLPELGAGLQALAVELPLHQGVHQVALLAADVDAPDHRQGVARPDVVAGPQLALHDRRRAV